MKYLLPILLFLSCTPQTVTTEKIITKIDTVYQEKYIRDTLYVDNYIQQCPDFVQAQLEKYRQETFRLKDEVQVLEHRIETLVPYLDEDMQKLFK